ncbi:MAG: TIGR00341 family protein [Alphaproteobacteria bacterium]|nr:TIGR00341 family protein [Alphaproteobacteria bacterium]
MIFLVEEEDEKQTLPDHALLPMVLKITPDNLASVCLTSEDTVLFHISDEKICPFIEKVVDSQARALFLNHQVGGGFARAMGACVEPDKALDLTLLQEAQGALDILYCNDKPVFSSVSIGGLALLRSSLEPGKRFLQRLANIPVINHRAFVFETAKGVIIRTVASAILVIETRQTRMMQKMFGESFSKQDGRLDMVVLSPTSILNALLLLVQGTFSREMNIERLPSGVGLIQSRSVLLKSHGEIDYLHDGHKEKASELRFEIKPRALKVCMSPEAISKNADEEPKESVRINGLPRGEEAETLERRPLPLFRHASTDDFKELFAQIRQNARWNTQYFLLLWLSTVMATMGLFMNSGPVIIGAMVLAPLMSPLISMAMGTARLDASVTRQSSQTVVVGVLVVLFVSLGLTLLLPNQHAGSEITARTAPNLFDLAVALVSGIVGAYATANENVAKSVAGIAIAVALVPPLCVAGIGLGWFDIGMFLNAMLLFLANLSGIVFGAVVAFWVMGYTPLRIAKKGMGYALLFMTLLAVPLGYALHGMLERETTSRKLENLQLVLSGGMKIKLSNVYVGSGDPLTLAASLVSPRMPTEEQMKEIKHGIEQQMNRQIELKASIILNPH